MEEKKMEEKKFLGGNLTKKLTFGLTWLLAVVFGWGWIAALVVLIVDKDKLDLEEKREMVEVIVCAVASIVLSFTVVVPLIIWVCSIIACVKAFTDKSFQIPGAYHIAKAIIK